MLRAFRTLILTLLAVAAVSATLYLALGVGAVLISLFVFATILLFSVLHGSEIVLRISGAQPIDDVPEMPMFKVLKTDLEALCEHSRLTVPNIYILDILNPNAFALGAPGKRSKIILTTGLLRSLSRVEVAGVVSHELAHIRAGDGALAAWIAAFAAIITSPISFARKLFGGKSAADRMASGMAFAPVANQLSVILIGRHRELKADREGAEICGDPSYLISALEKIERGGRATGFPDLAKHPELGHLLTINPSQDDKNGLFRTHPSTAFRIAELRQMVADA